MSIPAFLRASKLSVETDTLEGNAVHVLRGVSEEVEIRLWLDPSLDYAARRIDYRLSSPMQRHSRQFDAKRFRQQDGLFLVAEATVVYITGPQPVLSGTVVEKVVDGIRIQVSQPARDKNGRIIMAPERRYLREIKLVDLDFKPQFSDADFELLQSIADGTKVHMQDALRLNYVWREGAIRPVFDLADLPTEDAAALATRIAPWFDSQESSESRFRRKLDDARLSLQHLLVLVTQQQNAFCRQFFFEHHYGPERSNVADALAGYQLMCVGIGNAELAEDSRRLASRLGIAWPDAGEITLAVVDDQGRAVAQATQKELAPEGKIDPKRLVAFLRKHAPAVPDAEELLSEAMAQAGREQKRVLVQQSGPFCAPCIRLSRFVEKHHDAISKDYVYAKLDKRFHNGAAVIDRLRKLPGGVPWMVILDAEGRPLITSDGPRGNIGYPGEPEGARHFEKMLRSTARRLSDSEIDSLVRALGTE